MIRHLYIKNFVLIDELNLDFEEGFSAFTGETGAGKSILIDAISLLCAERASASFIMKGKDKAIIEGTFTFDKNSHAARVLEEAGFETEEETTFTRELHASNKSVARIDHRVVTLSLLRDALQDEIDIHGQRDNAYLLKDSLHIHLLDRYLQDEELLKETEDKYGALRRLEKEKEEALNSTYNENDLSYFSYQIKEIEEASLTPGEDEELEAKEKQYKAVRDSYDKLNVIFTTYDEEVSGGLYNMLRTIESLKADDEIEKVQSAFSDAYYNMVDALESLGELRDAMDLSEEEINAMEERLYTIQKLKRKYGHTIEDILAKKDELQQQVDMFAHKQEYLAKIDKQIARAKQEYDTFAAKLHEVRMMGCHNLDEEVMVHLRELMLPNARFKTSITEGRPSAYGSDRVEFLISMNKGEDLKPLSKTASGGELSRLMLGLKVIFTRLQGIETVIFDEIDTGVSGPVATSIGKEMRALSKSCQVFAVTHLAPVASCAEMQYLVSKSSDDNDTRTTVTQLDEEERIRQLALISSGEVTEASIQAARELFERNRS